MENSIELLNIERMINSWTSRVSWLKFGTIDFERCEKDWRIFSIHRYIDSIVCSIYFPSLLWRNRENEPFKFFIRLHLELAERRIIEWILSVLSSYEKSNTNTDLTSQLWFPVYFYFLSLRGKEMKNILNSNSF